MARSSVPEFGAMRANIVTAIKSERLISANAVVVSGTVIAGLFGVGFQSMASHQLRPADFAAVFTIVTILALIGLPAGAFTLLVARETSIGKATGQSARSAALLRGANQALLLLGVALAVLLTVTAPLLSLVLAISPALLVVAAAGLPCGLALPLLIGELQGEQRFVAFSAMSVGQAAVKIAVAAALGIYFGPAGLVGGISVATIATYVVGVRLVRRKLSIRPNLSWWRPALRYLAIVLPSTLALAVLLSSDVLLVKHFFSTADAGNYSVVAALGRAVFWGASGVAAVLFPKVTFQTTQGRSGTQIVIWSVALVAVGGIAGLAFLQLRSLQLIALFAGPGYAGAAQYLPAYTIGMVLLGAAAVLIATHQSRGKPGFLAVLLPLTLAEPFAILMFHSSLAQVIACVDASMLVVFIALAGIFASQHLRASAALVTRPTELGVLPIEAVSNS